MCENNLYGEWSPLAHTTAGASVVGRAAAYGIPGVEVDGNDVLAVREVALEATARARAGEGPTLVEARTYRHKGHSRVDPGTYRPKEEVEEWLRRDPIPRLAGAARRAAARRRSRSGSRPSSSARSPRPARPRYPPPTAPRARPRSPEMREVTFREAIRDALVEEMERDGRVFVMGEDVEPGGVFNCTPGIVERFGQDRIMDTPISEMAFAGAAFGAAVKGMRPVIEIMFGDFLGLVIDTLVNQSSKYWYLSNEQGSVPLVVRSAVGAGARFGACHSQTPSGWFLGEPGLSLVAASTPADAKGLLKTAIRDDNPVIVFEHKLLYGKKGEAADGDAALVPLGQRRRPAGRARTSRSSPRSRWSTSRSRPPSGSRATGSRPR